MLRQRRISDHKLIYLVQGLLNLNGKFGSCHCVYLDMLGSVVFFLAMRLKPRFSSHSNSSRNGKQRCSVELLRVLQQILRRHQGSHGHVSKILTGMSNGTHLHNTGGNNENGRIA